MSAWFASVALGIALTELCTAVFASAWFREQWSTAQGQLAVFRDAPNDDERQRAALRSGFSILRFSIICLVFVAFVGLLVTGPAWLLRWSAQTEHFFLVWTSASATAWWALRAMHHRYREAPTTSSSSSYGLLDRLVHWLALEPQVVRELTFEIERALFLPSAAEVSKLPIGQRPADGAVYVCGLARSGTTMLLEILAQMDCFRSLTYRDMPFVLAPNLWKAITRFSRRDREPVERAHGDGVMVDFDSAEAFEEVFWRTFSEPMRPGDLTYGAREPSEEALRTFADFRAIVANPRSRDGTAKTHKRYLSKNNNNLLRLRQLSADPTATILLVYRDPVATALSLHRQHMRFCASGDAFTDRYMRWLGHCEFGLGHVAISCASSRLQGASEPVDSAYWLNYWVAVYECVLAEMVGGVVLVNYDALCVSPQELLRAIARVVNLECSADTLSSRVRRTAKYANWADTFAPALLEEAYAVHRRLLIHPSNVCTVAHSPLS